MRLNIKGDEFKNISQITDEKGDYSISVFIDNERNAIDDTIVVGKYSGCIQIRIYADQIELFQEME